MQFAGVIPPMPTPIRDGRRIDTDALETYTEFLVENGVHGLFPCGSIGEFSSLTPSQRRQVIETVIESSGDRPVLAGCGHTSVDGVLDAIEDAQAAGADAAVVVTPYYLGSTQSGYHRFFETIADESSLPILLYNIPQLTGDALSVDVIAELATHPSVIGLKDSSGDLTHLYDVIQATPESFVVLQGAALHSSTSLDLGADGLVAGPATMFPAPISRLYEAHVEAEYETVRQISTDVITPLVSASSGIPMASGVKHLVDRAGYDIGGPLPPLPELEADERAELDTCFDEIVGTLERTESMT